MIFLVFFQMISAIPAGWALISDPSGRKLGFPLEMLEHSPFTNFLIPGLFLLVVLGIFPIIVFYGLITKNELRWTQKMNLYKNYHWSWAFSYYLGLLLILWINMELMFIKEFSMLQVAYSILGVLIVILTHLPSTKKDYKIKLPLKPIISLKQN